MTEIIYVDLYFFYNAAADALCLFAVSRLLPCRLRLSRLLAASALGGVYAVLLALFPLGGVLLPLSFFGASLLCTRLCFPKSGHRGLLSAYLLFLLTLFLLGGALTALQSLLSDSPIAESPLLLGALFVLLLLPALLFYLLCLRRRFDTKIVQVDLSLRSCTLALCALVDSGNLLRHPESQCPVVLCALSALTEAHRAQLVPDAQALQDIELTTAAGTRRLYGQIVQGAHCRRNGRSVCLPDFFLALDPDTRAYGGCELLLPTSLL